MFIILERSEFGTLYYTGVEFEGSYWSEYLDDAKRYPSVQEAIEDFIEDATDLDHISGSMWVMSEDEGLLVNLADHLGLDAL